MYKLKKMCGFICILEQKMIENVIYIKKKKKILVYEFYFNLKKVVIFEFFNCLFDVFNVFKVIYILKYRLEKLLGY